MGKVIELEEYRFKSDGMSVRQVRGMRPYARFKAKHHRLMQKGDKELKEAVPSEE
jgi:hypothetical protein